MVLTSSRSAADLGAALDEHQPAASSQRTASAAKPSPPSSTSHEPAARGARQALTDLVGGRPRPLGGLRRRPRRAPHAAECAEHRNLGLPRDEIVALIAAGLWIWGWRVRRIGLLLLGFAVCVLAIDLMNVYPNSRLVSTIGTLLLGIGGFSFAFHAAFSYPTGRLERHWPTRLWVFGWMYATGVVIAVPALLFQDLRDCAACRPRATSYLFVGHSVSWLGEWNRWLTGWLWLASAPLFVWLTWRRFGATSKGGRRTVWPFLSATLLAMFVSLLVTRSLAACAVASPRPLWLVRRRAGWLAHGARGSLGVLVARRARGLSEIWFDLASRAGWSARRAG